MARHKRVGEQNNDDETEKLRFHARFRYKLDGKKGEQFKLEQNGMYYNLRLPYAGPIKVHDLFTADYAIMPAFYGSDFLQKMEYINDKNLLIPSVLSKGATTTTIFLNVFCKYKAMEWSFQNECRFILHITPIDKNARFIGSNKIGDILPTITKNFDFLLHDYYLELKEDIFDNLEILIRPKCSKGELEIVETLAEKYAPKAVISSSCFTGKLK